MEYLYTLIGSAKFNKSEDLFKYLVKTQKKIIYTFGLDYRNPTINKVEITPEQAIENIKEYFGDVIEYEDYIHVKCFSSNDLW